MVARYGKHEAKDAARELLQGVMTAPCLPVTADGRVDEAGLRADIRHCLDVIGSSGLYMNGYYGHFWLLDVARRKQVIEIATDEVSGAVPVIARCAHPSPYEAIDLARHAQEAGADFISLVSPQFGGAHPDVLMGYVRMIAREVDLGITIFNTAQAGYVISPAAMAELATIPNVCALKNGMPMAHTIQIRELVGDRIVVIDPDEEHFLTNMVEFGQRAIYTGTNMMFDRAGARPMRYYVQAGLAGRFEEAARLYGELQPIRDLHRRWVLEPWETTGLCPISTVKYWSQQLGMTGGGVPECLPSLSEVEQDKLRAEMAGVGLIPAA